MGIQTKFGFAPFVKRVDAELQYSILFKHFNPYITSGNYSLIGTFFEI